MDNKKPHEGAVENDTPDPPAASNQADGRTDDAKPDGDAEQKPTKDGD